MSKHIIPPCTIEWIACKDCPNEVKILCPDKFKDLKQKKLGGSDYETI